VERARAVVENLVGKKRPRDSSKDLPFSRDAKKIFETALMASAWPRLAPSGLQPKLRACVRTRCWLALQGW
jgi:hypothetical protein